MGQIHEQVVRSHFNKFPSERELLSPFLVNFDVSFATRRSGRQTNLSIYYIEPEKAVREQFGIESEILLAICDYEAIQVRNLQLIEDVITGSNSFQRVDKTVYFLVVKNDRSKNWIENYISLNPQERVPVVITYKELESAGNIPWFIRNSMSEKMYSRDLFAEQLPLESDTFFFGRDRIVAELLDTIKQSKNKGIFGLRKTGKTSVLFKLKRIAEPLGYKVLYYDCKDPSIRSLDWKSFIERMTSDLAKLMGKNLSSLKFGEAHVSEKFRMLLRMLTGNARVAIIFDEIEYISPISKLDEHWQKEFVPFWQTLWTTQSQFRKISYIMAGVNPSVIEVDIIDGVQNPIFGIVSPTYLTGLSDVDTRSLLGQLGKRMGLKFEFDALVYLFERFGGHPLLTRMAGSYIDAAVNGQGISKPYRLTKEFLVGGEESLDREIAFYCRHITSELKIFYPDEYELLEMLAAGNEADFFEFSRDESFINHLVSYGLIECQQGQKPRFRIPALEKYVNLERIKKNKGQYEFQVVPTDRRSAWLKNRLDRITADLRLLTKKVPGDDESALWGSYGFPDAEKFLSIQICGRQEEFVAFINVCNKCFVESLEEGGKKRGLKKYFFEVLKEKYPELWDSLLRIKLYRHNEMHLNLMENVDADLKSMLDRDLKGRRLDEVKDGYFVLQQMVLDGLFLGAQLEIDKRA